MTLLLSTPLYLSGLAALAALLFAMQRLRVRYRQQRVATTLFWREAVEETRARVWLRRFRHPLSYLLVLTIAALLWSAFAHPRRQVDDSEQHWLLLDGSAAMTPASLDRAGQELIEVLPKFPRGCRSVWLCGAWPRLLLAPGEDNALLASRLQGCQPEPAISSIGATLRDLGHGLAPHQRGVATLFGVARLSDEEQALLPDLVVVQRSPRSSDAVGALSNNVGITSFGVTEAASLAWDRVDVYAEVRGASVTATTPVAVFEGATPWGGELQRTWVNGVLQLSARDVAADGQRFEMRLGDITPNTLSVDDSAALQLPRRSKISVAVSPTVSLQGELGSALQLDPSLFHVSPSDDADVVVRRRGENFGSDKPALVWSAELVPSGSADPPTEFAFYFHHEANEDSAVLLRQLLQRLGIDQIDAMELAQQTGHNIAVGAEVGERRQVQVWESLLSRDYSFVNSRGFPLFVSSVLHWLADVRPFPNVIAVGEPVLTAAATLPVLTADGRRWDPLGNPLRPLLAGEYRAVTAQGPNAAEIPVRVPLLDPSLVSASASKGTEAWSVPGADGWDAVTWIACIALALLLIEWWAVREGRMP